MLLLLVFLFAAAAAAVVVFSFSPLMFPLQPKLFSSMYIYYDSLSLFLLLVGSRDGH